MHFIFVWLIFNISIVFITGVSGIFDKTTDWNHQHQAKWYDVYKECILDHQSPIEINTRDVIIAFFIPPVTFRNYNATCPKLGKITNNGHTAEIILSKDCMKPQISGGPLPYNSTYEAVSFHFHWGSKNSHGSEHVINSKRYSMETHIVHRNMKYATIEEARKHRDGLTVLAMLYEANESTKKEFDGLKNIVKSLKSILKFNTTTGLKGLRLDSLMGQINTDRFYTYQGSLTTPPCSQVVTWIIFPQVIDITLAQMERFRLLATGSGESLVNNYRFLQPKGKRKVYFRRNILPPVAFEGVSMNRRKPATPGPFDDEEEFSNQI